MEPEQIDDEVLTEEELVTISKERQKRKSAACPKEDRQGLLWARTAECAAMDVPAAALFSPTLLPADGQAEMTWKPPTFLRRVAVLGLA